MKNLLILLCAFCLVTLGCEQDLSKQSNNNRHITLEGEPNFRDLGGYQTVDGKTVKWGLIYRSGKLSQLTGQDVAVLDSLEIKKVVNFLTPGEIAHAGPDKVPEVTEVIVEPIDTGDDLALSILEARKTGDFSGVDASINPELHRMLVEEAKDQYAMLFREIIGQQNEPLVFHCSHGIHRTGTAAAILLWSLGVPWDTIREDYLLSNNYRSVQIEKRVNQLVELGKTNPDVTDQDLNIRNIEAFYILQDHYIDAVKETIESEYGSIDKYMRKGLGLTQTEIDQLREQLLY
jgi:protein-tyrosine phosphatase